MAQLLRRSLLAVDRNSAARRGLGQRRQRRPRLHPPRLRGGGNRPDPGRDPARRRRHGRPPHRARPALDRPALPDLRHRRLLRAAAQRRTRRLQHVPRQRLRPLQRPRRRHGAGRTASGKCDETWAGITRLALWAEPTQNHPAPPFRWVGYDGDAGHGCGNHLHLSWQHAAAPQFQLAEWVEVFPVGNQPSQPTAPPPAQDAAQAPPPGPSGGFSTVHSGGALGPRGLILQVYACRALGGPSPGRFAGVAWGRTPDGAHSRSIGSAADAVSANRHSPWSLPALAILAGCGSTDNSTPVACLEGAGPTSLRCTRRRAR